MNGTEGSSLNEVLVKKYLHRLHMSSWYAKVFDVEWQELQWKVAQGSSLHSQIVVLHSEIMMKEEHPSACSAAARAD